MISTLGNEYSATLFIDSYTKWEVKITWCVTHLSKPVKQVSVWCVDADDVITTISNNDPSTLINCNSSWIFEGSTGAGRTKVAGIVVGFTVSMDAGLVPVRHVYLAITAHSYTPRLTKWIASKYPTTQFGDKFTCAQETYIL